MATYILFWNPAISSYTMDRFQEDFKNRDCVGNWSFYEHDNVMEDDIFYMVRCGEGKTGIVMRGIILTECYESYDWSPKNRKHIFYADIESSITIDPETASVMLTPELLTEKLPDFNWFGGHSGRLLNEEYAQRLDEIWLDYINNNPSLFSKNQAFIDDYHGAQLTDDMKIVARKTAGKACEVCGYDYNALFPGVDKLPEIEVRSIVAPKLKRLIYAICRNCYALPDDVIAKKLQDK